MAINMYPPIITLNINGLNVPIKRHRVVEWIRNQDPCLSPKDPSQKKRCTQSKSKEMEKDISCKWKKKEADVAKLIPTEQTLLPRRILHNDKRTIQEDIS